MITQNQNPQPQSSSSKRTAPIPPNSDPAYKPGVHKAIGDLAKVLSCTQSCANEKLTVTSTNEHVPQHPPFPHGRGEGADCSEKFGLDESAHSRTLSTLLVAMSLSWMLASCGGGVNSQSPPPPPFLSLAASPNSLTIYPNTSFVVTVTASTDQQVTPSLTAAELPAGITTTTTFPVPIPFGGVAISLQTDGTLTGSNYTLTFSGQAGAATASKSVSATLQPTAPAFYFLHGLFHEVGVPFGGSGQMQFPTGVNDQGDYEVELSLSGLPPGTTATINPPTILVGKPANVTITASGTAPQSQNLTVTLTGTPLAPADPASIAFLVDVTPPPGSLPNNRTDYVSTEDTPYAAVYDPKHALIFASNSSWNRVDVISTASHTIVTRIPIREPRGIDITQDNSTVWVASGSRQVFAINTSSFVTTRFLLPQGPVAYWEGSQLFALSDGTLMIFLTHGTLSPIDAFAIWNPVSNAIKFPTAAIDISPDGFFRSGNGKRVYFFSSTSGGDAFYYDVPSKAFSNLAKLGGYALGAAVNVDATRIVVCDVSGPNMYDGNFSLIGQLPACGFGSPPYFFQGGPIFSPDNRYLYIETLAHVPQIIKVDALTLNVVSTAPAMPMIPVMVELSPPYFVPIPFAVDNTGMVFGLEFWGIAFDDGAFAQTYSGNEPGTPSFMQHMTPYFGPLNGGTVSGGFGNAFSINPDVWYGTNRGTADNQNPAHDLTITSPPTSTPGPVSIKILFPDGIEVFDPLFFSYGPYLQYALVSGAPPQGNVAAQVVGYGMAGDNVTGTLTVGGSVAPLVAPKNGELPLAGTPFSNKVLDYTVPAGLPGWADLNLTTPDGSATLPKSLFYARSVTDYPSSDTFTAVLYDDARQQVYLSAGDHIDVFSLSSNQFVAPLNPPAQGAKKQFAGLALTPDGSLLLAGDLLDGSLAVVNPDSPGSAYFIPIAPVTQGQNCSYGPFYVAPIINNQAFVVTGAFPSPTCGPGGTLYLANLANHTAGPPPPAANCGAAFISATRDGGKVALGGNVNFSSFCIYDVASNTSITNDSNQDYGGEISADGQVAASEFVLTDSSANTVGRVAKPDIYYAELGTNTAQPNLLVPQLNDAGSLYYMAFGNFFDIVDVQHGILRMRFSLSETVQNTAVPMAIDSGGRFVFLITDKGLTVVDLGEAPLSIGWFNLSTASPGTQVTVRGSGFGSTTRATVGGEESAVSVIDQNTLTLTVPAISPGQSTIVLTNGDGTTYSLASVLTVQ